MIQILEGKKKLNQISLANKLLITHFSRLMRILFDRFFKQYLVILCINQMASALFRFMAALGRDIVVGNTFGTFSLLAVTVLGGFVISRGKKIVM